jgi:hypothetical protein
LPAIAGGTALISTNSVINNVLESSSDPIGQWCSTKFQGKGNHSIRFISAYRCAVKNINGPLSVWSQQHYLLNLEHINTDPIEKFDEDLICFLCQCLDGGKQSSLELMPILTHDTALFRQSSMNLVPSIFFSANSVHRYLQCMHGVPCQLTLSIPPWIWYLAERAS